MREFKREFAIYLGSIVLTYSLIRTNLVYYVGDFLPEYLVAQLTVLPLFIILAAQFYMAKAVYEDSFEHDLDYDWWMIVPLLGPIGVLIYYLDRENKL